MCTSIIVQVYFDALKKRVTILLRRFNTKKILNPIVKSGSNILFLHTITGKEPNAGCLHHLSRLMEKINKNIPSLPPLFPFLLGAFIWYTSFQCQRISWFMALYDWNQFGLTCFFLCIVLLFVALLVDTYLNMDKQFYSNLLWILMNSKHIDIL